MAEERTLEGLLKIIQEQAATIKQLLEENATLKKRIGKLERQVKRYVSPHSREQPKAGPKSPDAVPGKARSASSTL